MEQQELSFTADGNAKWDSHSGRQYGVLYLFILVVLDLCCCAQASHSAGFSYWGTQALRRGGFGSCDTPVSYPTAQGSFSDQGLNPCPLHWQVDSLPLAYHGSPGSFFKKLNILLYILSMVPLGIYPNNWKLMSIQNLHTDVYTNFIHNCYNLEANWCSSVGKRINKSQYIQTKDYFLVLKRKELSSHKKTLEEP